MANPVRTIDTPIGTMEGVGAGQTATKSVPIGRRYHDIALVTTDLALDDILQVRVKANAKVIQYFSGAQRDMMNQYDGLEAFATDNILLLPQDRQKLKDRANEVQTALNTGVRGPRGEIISSLTIEVDIAAGAVGASPAIELWAYQSVPVDGGPGAVMHIRPLTRTIGGAGDLVIADFSHGGPTTAALNRMFIQSAAVTRLKLERELYTVFDRTAALNTRRQNDGGVRIPQANTYVFDPSEKGYGANGLELVGVRDFRATLTCSGAANPVLIPEWIGALGD